MKLLITHHTRIREDAAWLDGRLLSTSRGGAGSDFLRQLYRENQVNYPKFFKMDLLSRLGFLASELLLKEAALHSRHSRESCGVFLLTGHSSLDTDEKHQATISDRTAYFPSPSVFVYTLPNIMIGEISIRHGLKGENCVFVTPEPDTGLFSDILKEAFNNGRVTAVLCGWVDAYHDQLSAAMMVVESEHCLESSPVKREYVIFEPQNIDRFFKES